MLKTTNFS